MSNLRVLQTVAAVMVLGMVPGAATAQSQASGEKIRLAVIKQLQDHNLRRGNLQVTVMGDTVTLAGQMQSLWEKNEAVKHTLRVKGVEMVASDLVIARAESDKAIADQLGERILRYNRYTIYDDIGAFVRDGVVTLDGWVTDSAKASDIADRASRIRGVQDLKNNLKTYPPMQGDDRLRIEVARRIFTISGFETYAIQPNPPIHIIVVYGRVTLNGQVGSLLDKQQAGIAAREVIGVMSLDNQLQTDR